MKKGFILILLLPCLLLSACTHKPPQREESVIIREMVQGYGKEPAAASGQVDSLLKELEAVNRDTAADWQEIMGYWDDMNHSEIRYGSLPDGLDGKLCIIVLGFQLNADGSMKEELLGRLRTALSCAWQYPDAYILCTGGGTASGNRDATEAGEMARWLQDNGIAENRLIVENRSLSTTQNAEFSYEILQKDYPDVTAAVIVTSDYHIPWGAVLFQTEFILKHSDIRIASHTAYAAENPGFYNILRYQTSGILDLARLH